MNDFQELLRSSDETMIALGRLTDPVTVLDGEDLDPQGGWIPWGE